MTDERGQDGPDGLTERRVGDAATLRALAHPLRLKLLGLLRALGPSTATRLAARCGTSSGLTSYHLRHLAAAGLIVDAAPDELVHVTPSGGRERWWRAAHARIITEPPRPEDADATAAGSDYDNAVLAARAAAARSWLDARHAWPVGWQRIGNFSDILLRLTVAEAEQLGTDLLDLLNRYRRNDPAAPAPAGTAIVAAQVQVFPYPDQPPPAPT